MSRVFLGLSGVIFVLFGLWGLITPISMLTGFGIDVSGPHALIEMRAVYGGLCLAAGGLMLASLFRENLALPALWFIAIYCGGILFGRATSILVDGLPMTWSWAIIVFEFTLLAGAVVFLRQNSQAR